MAIIAEPYDNAMLENYGALAEQLRHLREVISTKVVFTGGVWDLLHEGHIRYLRKAKAEGNLLIVGVDSDEHTRARKGEGRPLVTQNERIEILRELRSIDYLVLINSFEDYFDCLRVIRPDVVVISETTKDFPEERRKKYEEHCGRLVIFEPQAVITTTSRLRNLMLDGGRALANKVQQAINDHFGLGEN